MPTVTGQSKLSREEAALLEMRATAISRPLAWGMNFFFCLMLAGAPLFQSYRDWRDTRHVFTLPAQLAHAIGAAARPAPADKQGLARRLPAFNRRLLAALHSWERTLEDQFAAAKLVRPAAQYLLARWGKIGNEKVYCGLERWLFYRPDVDYIIGASFLDQRAQRRRQTESSEWTQLPQPDPRRALLNFHQQLQERNIQLIVMPTPVKSVLQPDQFWRGIPKSDLPLHNSGYQRFLQELREAGLTVFDPSIALARDFAAQSRPVFLATDTHWRPEVVEYVAQVLADFIRTNFNLPPISPQQALQTQKVAIAQHGDLTAMLPLPHGQNIFTPEKVHLRQILAADGAYWRPDTRADILLLGDSFANIYSLPALGWGASAGLAEHLSYALQRPLDCILINDNAAFAPRLVLQRELQRGRNRLAGKRIVIYQFAVRELASGDWRMLTLPAKSSAPATGFLDLPSGGRAIVRGTVVAISTAPRPGSVPYRDHIVCLLLADLEGAPGKDFPAQALVYTWSMRENQLQPGAHLRVGETVEADLRAWEDFSTQLERINRSELDTPELQLAPPCWATRLRSLGFAVQ